MSDAGGFTVEGPYVTQEDCGCENCGAVYAAVYVPLHSVPRAPPPEDSPDE